MLQEIANRISSVRGNEKERALFILRTPGHTLHELTWCEEIRYLGIYLTASREYNAKCSFYRAFNAMCGKVGRCASEEVIVELLKLKCLPVLFMA